MGFLSKLRFVTTKVDRVHHFSSLKVPSTTEKSVATLSCIRSETNPQRILDICRAAFLTPQSHIDRVSYSKAVSKLRKCKYFDGIRSLLENSKARVVSLSQDDLAERNISYFILLYGKAGLLEDSIDTFRQLEELGVTRTVIALNSLLSASVLAKEYEEMKRIFTEFPDKYGVMPDLMSYNMVIKGFSESGQTNVVYSVVAEMERKGLAPNDRTFVLMTAGFYMENKLEDVDKGLEMMEKRGIEPRIYVINGIIRSMWKLKKTNEARMLLDRILSRWINLKPNSYTYGHLVYGYCREGDSDAAMWAFLEMKRRRLIPKRDCYDTLVYYLCQWEDFEMALKVCKKCFQKNWLPRFSVLKSLVEGLVNISEVNVAHKLIRQIKRRFPRETHNWSEIEEGLPEY